MDDKRNEMIYITMYVDDSGLFSEDECDYDNTVGFDIPRWILEDWYKQDEDVNKKETMDELGISEEEATFDRWIEEVYTHDGFIGFYDFCLIKGYVPNIIDDYEYIENKVYYVDDDEERQILFKGTYDECRRYGRFYNWKYHDYRNNHKYNLELEVK